MIDILAFTHGTIVMHGAALGVARVERVRQVQQRIASVQDISHDGPVEQAHDKLWRWHDYGA